MNEQVSKPKFAELHSHLYGCLSSELLFEIGKNNPSPRWNIYTDLYEKLYHKKVDTKNFFKDYNNPQKLESIYYFRENAPFLEFQSKFNLIIALARFDEMEIQYVARSVLIEHFLSGIEYSEFRIMYSPFATEEDYRRKTIAACEGLHSAELDYSVIGRLIVSLHRENGFEQQYQWLKKLMDESDLVSKYLVGIDFCNVEEGYPPKLKKNFFKKILRDNEENPSKSLSILYHVAESFTDKSHISACRWILESSMYGAHRLGHCIALGEKMDKYINIQKMEKLSEFIDTNDFIMNHYDEIRTFGNISPFEHFNRNKELGNSDKSSITIIYNEEFLSNLFTFRKYVVHKLIQKKTIIESCPTSNLRIGMIGELKNLPINHFTNYGLDLTIGADDPGILNTSLPEEYEICKQMGISDSILNSIREESFNYKSEIISGRE